MWRHMLRLQFHTMVRKKSFYFALVVMAILTAAFSLQLIGEFRGIDRAVLQPAWYKWNGNQLISRNISETDYTLLTGFCGFLFIPFLGPLAYSDFYYDQLKNGVIKGSLTRSTRAAYFTTGAMAAFVGAAVIFLIPYLFEQVLLLILCAGAPQQNAAASSPLQDNWGEMSLVPSVLWPLQMNHPYLYNVLLSFVPAVVAGAFSVFCFAVSLYFHRNRFLVLTLPGILLWLAADYGLSMTGLSRWIPSLASATQIGAGATRDLLADFIYTVLLLLVSFLLIRHKCRKAKDVLV